MVEAVEPRLLLAAVAVNAADPLRTVTGNFTGTNLTSWQWEQTTPQMQSLLQADGLHIFRIGGGSAVDDNEHFNAAPPYNGYQTLPNSANVVAALGGTAIVTVNYGTGSPQEAAAELAYLDAKVGDTTPIGMGQQWNPPTNTWVQVNWQTAGYWAALRAAAPLHTDDGLNFLRQSRPTPYGFTRFEVGNEEYATWETDEHGSGGSSGAPHDPATYIAFASSFNNLAQQILPGASVGLDVTVPLKYNLPDQDWTADLLKNSVADGFVPGFFSDHVYITGLSDQNLLDDSVDNANYINADGIKGSWTSRASYYRNLITQSLGAIQGAGVQLMATEFNADLSNKQSISLVNGLWMADAVGGLTQTEYTAALEWDLTNGYSALSADPAHYGWRNGDDEGLLSTGSANGSTSGAYVPYPTYFAEGLLSKIYQNGAQVLPTTSSDANFDVFAAREPSGDVELMVINKSEAGLNNDTTGTPASIAASFSFNGFTPSAAASQWQYGSAQDNAQQYSGNGAAALAVSTPTLTMNGNSFSLSFSSYSMSVIDLKPDHGPTVATPAAPVRSTDAGTSSLLSVLGAENGGDLGLTYTWSAAGPAPVTFSATTLNGSNGTNAAKSILAQFSQAGNYSFTATITDPQGLSTTSTTSVDVLQTSTTVLVTPEDATVLVDTTQQFSAVADDQFGNPISGAAFTWSTSGAPASISGSGLLSVGSTPGSIEVNATQVGGVAGSAYLNATPLPLTQTAAVNGNNAALAGVQRSMVDSVAYTFNAPVLLSSTAFSIALHAGQSGTLPTLSWSALDPDAQGYSGTWIVTFSGAGVVGRSIADGVYDLTLAAGAATSVYTAQGNDSASAFTFQRLFGDVNGDGSVNLGDFGAMRAAFGNGAGSAGYLAALDYNGDGTINLLDFGQFTKRYGLRI